MLLMRTDTDGCVFARTVSDERAARGAVCASHGRPLGALRNHTRQKGIGQTSESQTSL